ncbi:aminoglycoside phosphotransferase [Citricoccus zhacaiensis]|uniref:Aminoglycoside phosphotransferase n=1 Tax=Citricoccus zhacaiensis TaxID=489142 RepID=A0ABQ2LR80_9MICC|nr:phosphotransferase [Citricoccus zhacaiensis]GGO40861.1 aminoglycoside phosphotransferase [Citricoccus zhacaiensis]
MPWELRDGEPVIDPALARALLREQHPDLARMPLGEPVRGWDNTMVRLGERLALRLPRHAQAETLLDREVAWLPRLASQLLAGLPSGTAPHTIPAIPTPARTGVPGAGYPFRWAVVPWVHGTPAVHAPLEVRDAYAPSLAATLRALHQPAPADAPASAFRGVDLADVEDRFARRWDALAGDLGRERRDQLAEVWSRAVNAAPYCGPRVWLHGDPHPNNTVLAGVGPGPLHSSPVLVDFGDLCAGDPASDLGSALLHFSPSGREAFMTAYDAGLVPDSALWARAQGWAVNYALIFAAQSPGEALRPLGRGLLG